MWEQILKFDDIVVNRKGDENARAAFDPETNALILNLNQMVNDYKGLRDISDEDIIGMLEEAKDNPLMETEFTNFDKKNVEYMNETLGDTLTKLKNELREERDYTETEINLVLAKFKRLINRYIFDNTNYRIEESGDLESIIGTLAHEGTHYGQSTIPELREKLDNTINNLIKVIGAGIGELGTKRILNTFNNVFKRPEINLEEGYFNELSKSLVEVAMLTATMEVQPALMEKYGESPSLLANRILADYIEPQLKQFIENLLEAFESLGTEVDKNNLIKVIRFAQNEIKLKIGKLLDNIKYVKKSWELVIGFDDINKKSKARRKKQSKRTKKKRRRSGDNFKREKDEGLHGWFSRRGGKQKKGGKTQRGWIACGTCNQKGGPKPCGRADASKGRKRRCRPTCAACKTYKRRKGSP
tara:strand:- start:2928 stop:4172 length:1245 start_codon:yes stop_codon:yes gene_type:complete